MKSIGHDDSKPEGSQTLRLVPHSSDVVKRIVSGANGFIGMGVQYMPGRRAAKVFKVGATAFCCY